MVYSHFQGPISREPAFLQSVARHGNIRPDQHRLLDSFIQWVVYICLGPPKYSRMQPTMGPT